MKEYELKLWNNARNQLVIRSITALNRKDAEKMTEELFISKGFFIMSLKEKKSKFDIVLALTILTGILIVAVICHITLLYK